MDLVDYLISSGLRLERASGVEYFGPCPFCPGGNDRFRVFRDGGGKNSKIPGHFFCRVCKTSGDHISWLRDVEGLSYREATGGDSTGTRNRNKSVPNCSASPDGNRNTVGTRNTVPISEKWESKAEVVLSSAWQEMSKPGAVEFYRGRGLTPETCEALGFGWQSSDSFFPAEEWGLAAGEKLVVPAGAVMPVRRGGRVVSLQVRRLTPYTPKGSSKPMRHHHTRGGARVPFLCGPSGVPLVVVESILCAASIFQASGGTVAAVALCGATKGKGAKLDRETVEAIEGAAVVLVAGDRDEAGKKVLEGVLEVRPDAYPYAVPSVINDVPLSDPNDLLKLCGDKVLKGWLLYGIQKAEEARCEPGKGDVRAMPERSETIDQEHGGEASDTMETPRDDGPDEFAAHVAQVRGAWPDGPPMIAPDMPDWSAFCVGWWQDCFRCPYYDGSPNGSPCELWEAAFPCAVRWYPPTC